MHISEGVLDPLILAGGGALSIAGIVVGLKMMRHDEVPKVGVLTAAFFVASLVHVPIGPASAHLVLNGLVGLLLGWACFPAILVALALQTVFFQYGGITVLGVNTANMALPALLAYLLFRPMLRGGRGWTAAGGFLAGSSGVLGAGVMVALALALTGKPFLPAAQTVLVVHIPVMAVEGIVTSIIVVFIKRIRPEMLFAPKSGEQS
jgi:cobalt/nickel transport system permease protein